MCIIVAKPCGVSMPNNKTLRNCFDSNPDGAGFMVATGKTVELSKGYMTYADFIEAIESYGDLTEYSVVMHFRITTSGGTMPECCHPFPVTSNIDKLRELDSGSRVCVAHNGVISGMKTSYGCSDTMAFIRDIVSPIRNMSEDFIHNSDALSLLETIAGSKLCFMDNSGEIVTVGNFIESDGVLYSNSTYLDYKTNYSTYTELWDELDPGFYDEVDSIAHLMPWSHCRDCAWCIECFSSAPYCSSDSEAYATADESWYDCEELEEHSEYEQLSLV